MSIIDVPVQGLPFRGAYPTTVDGLTVLTSFYEISGVRFGDVEVKTPSSLITNVELIEPFMKGLDGLLGNGIFDGYWLELSFSRNEIVLHNEIPARFARAARLPLAMLENANSMLFLPITIDSTEYLILIDTGMGFSLSFPVSVADRAGSGNLTRIESIGETGDYYLVQTSRIKFMDMEFSDKLIMSDSVVPARWGDGGRMRHVGIVGMDFLSNFDLLLDYRTLAERRSAGLRYISLVPPGERTFDWFGPLDAAPEPGIINARFTDAGLEIISIIVDGLAYGALGLRAGSVITKINGEPAGNFTLAQLRGDPLFFQRLRDFSLLVEGEEIIVRLAP